MSNKLRLLAVVGALLFLPSVATVVSPDSVFASSVVAAEEKKVPKYKDVKTRKRASVGKSCAKALDKLQGEKGPITLATAADEKTDVSGLWTEAKNMLNNIESREKLCSSPYELTRVWNLLAYVSYSLDDLPGAIRYYKRIVESEGAEEEFRLDTRLTLGQFYAATEQYGLAIRQFELWAEKAFIIGSQQRLMMAQLYSILERKDEALKMADIGISEAEAKGEVPKQGFWQLQVPIYYDRDNLEKVTSLLEKLVKHYPKWTYWKQLGGMYGSKERDIDQLVAYDVVYLNGELSSETDVMSMAYMYLGAEVPFRAAKIIEKGMKDEIIEISAKNLEVLGTAWYQSKDLDNAVKALEDASKESDTGNLQARLAGIYLDLGRDKEAYKAATRAAKKGGVKRPESNYLVMGNALVNLHCYKDAVGAFKKSIKEAKDEKNKRYPRQWIRYADTEGDRLQKLRDVGATVPGCSKG
mgnify:CR=1 FL=1